MVDESLDLESLRRTPEEWEFRAKPAWQRLIVMLGGIIVNIITGIVIYTFIVYHYGITDIPAREAKYGIVAHELAQEIGLQTGDRILQINGKPFERFTDIYSPELLLGSNGYYTVERNGRTVNITVPTNLIERLNDSKNGKQFVSAIEPFKVGDVQPGSEAAKAGLQPGDRFITINEEPIRFFHELQAALLKFKGDSIKIRANRNGRILNLAGLVTEDGKLGFRPESMLFKDVKHFGFLQSVPIGSVMAFDVIWLNIQGFGKIFRREISAKNSLSSPLAIARDGFGGNWIWENFWRMTGFLSMVLAFMNFLPIPALDGGHVVFLAYEIISRRKPSEKFLENAQKVGMVLLLSLMVFAFYNDISKMLTN